MKKRTIRIAAILIAIVMLIGSSIGMLSAFASPNYDVSTVQDIKAALKSYEDKFTGNNAGKIYKNMAAAYTAYTNLSNDLDLYYYGNGGNAEIGSGTITSHINALKTAVSNMTVWSSPGSATTKNMLDSDLLFTTSNEYPWRQLKSEFTGVIWAQQNYDPGADGSKGNAAGVRGVVDQDTVSYYLCYPTYVLLWDGSTKASFGVLLEGDTEKSGSGGNNYRYFYGASVKDTAVAQGMSLERGWGAENAATWGNTTRDFGWNLFGSTKLTYSGSSLTNGDTSLWLKNNAVTSRKSYHRSAANMVTYNGTSSTDFVLSIYPAFTTYTGSDKSPTKQGNWNGDIVLDVTGNQAIYVLNYKALVDVLTNFSKSLNGNISNYREGGLKAAMAAFDEATAYNYNTDFDFDGDETTIANKMSEVKTKFEGWKTALTSGMTTDGYTALRNAIDNTTATYFEDTATDGGVNPMQADGLNVKYCPEPWKTFADYYKQAGIAGGIMYNVGYSRNYSNTSDRANAANLATLLQNAYNNLKEHKADSNPSWVEIPADTQSGKYKKASCTENGLGVEYSKCVNTSCTTNFIVDANSTIQSNGHTYVKTEESQQDCTQPGRPAYYQCIATGDALHEDGCNKYFEEDGGQPGKEINGIPDETDKLGHDFKEINTKKDATCLEVGYKETIYQCDRCSNYYLDGDEQNTDQSNVNIEYVQKNEISKLPHKDDDFTEAETATCLVEGHDAYYFCDMCQHYFADNEGEIGADLGVNKPGSYKLAHSFTEYVYDADSQKDDTCITPGTMTATCDNGCGTTDTQLDPTHPAEGHKFEKEGAKTERVLPTCKDSGNVEFYTCDNCGKNFNTNSPESRVEVPADQLNIAATGMHSFVLHSKRDATCEEQGHEAYYSCSVCEKAFDTDQQDADDADFDKDHVIDPSDLYTSGMHKLIPHSKKTATCNEQGYDMYFECAYCAKLFDSSDQGDDLDQFEEEHGLKEVVKYYGNHNVYLVSGFVANCVEGGEDDHYECINCEQWFSDDSGADDKKIETVQPTAPDPNNHYGHFIKHDAQEASCAQEGWSQDVYECSECGKFYSQVDGSKTEDENKLGDTLADLKDYYTEPLPHDQDDRHSETVFRAASCTEKGVRLVELWCTVCKTYQTTIAEDIAKSAHQPSTTEAIEGFGADCQTPGEKNHFECDVCHQYFAENDSKCEGDPIDIVIPTVNHDFSNSTADYTVIVTNATCTANAIVEYLCTYDCKTHSAAAERSDGIYGKTDHDLTKHEKAATCLEDGEPLYYSCANCGFNFADNEEYTENYYTGNTSTPATGHSFKLVDADAKIATCEEEGRLAYYVCENDNCDLTGAKFLDNTDTKATEGIKDGSELLIDKDTSNHTKLEFVASTTTATCDPWTNGIKDYNYCDGCKNYYEVSDVNYKNPIGQDKFNETFLVAPEHTLDKTPAQDKSCTEDGWTDYWTCTVCGEFFSAETPKLETENKTKADFMLEAEGHTFGAYNEAVEATCVKEGIAGYYKCSECQIIVICDEADADEHDVKFYDGDDTDKINLGKDENNHVNINPEDGSDATCLAPGLKDHFKCADCGKLFEDEEGNQELTDDDIVADPLGHDFTDDDAHHEYKAPTCTEAGNEEYWHCDRCDKNFKNGDLDTTEEWDNIVIAATGHQNIVPIEGKAATCTEDGIKDHYICKDCNTEFVDEKGETEVDDENVKIDALGHEEAEVVRENEVPATCLADGSYQEVVYCVRHAACGYEFSRVDKTINKIDHVFGEYTSDNNATCQKDGTKTAYCTFDCGTSDVKPDEGSMLDHAMDEGYPMIPATCVAEGVMRFTCTTCDPDVAEVYTYDKPIPPTGKHTYEVVESKDATCLEDGYIRYECSVCGDPKTEILNAAGAHSWDNGTITKKATCTEKGEMTYKCTICGETKTEPIEMIAHTPGEAQVENYVPTTPETEGSYDLVVRCTECGTILSSVHVIIDPIDDEVDLKILEGADQTYVIDSYIDKTIVCNGPYNKFVGLLLKGEIVDENNYTVREGSTVITLKAEYLNTLAPGKYEVVLMYTYDSIATTLTVIENPNSGSGDNGNGGNGGNGGSGNGGNTGNVPGGNTGNGGTGNGQDTTQGSNGSGANANNSNTSPSTGTEIALPIILVATVGGFIAIMFARRRKASDAE